MQGYGLGKFRFELIAGVGGTDNYNNWKTEEGWLYIFILVCWALTTKILNSSKLINMRAIFQTIKVK